ncbi:MAG: oxaloacetate-decarboxylating malate dehydrogenase, partial [Nitrospirota bacterium]|nr:oxaloacetate-decarboxylating malate dehydrogenase [Nitrospirota bacterium]
MIEVQPTRDPKTGEEVLASSLTGQALQEQPFLNKGLAFTFTERGELGLQGLLPPHEETLAVQLERAYQAYRQKVTDLERHIFLRALQDENETLFYALLLGHVAEMMPIVYTPVVGAACQQFSHIYRRPRGLFISVPEQQDIDTILENRPYRDVDVIVVTDGERILGLGDQGAGGMGIPIGKLSLYTLCGGIHPTRTLPIILDAGTNNAEALRDPLYVGWRHERVRGQEYDDFIDAFVQAVKRKLPNVLLQWEDFAQANAGRLLDRYRDQLCTFNDDIQGTASVTTGTLLAAVKVTGSPLRDQRVVTFGAGSAGCGISEQICAAMVREGLSEAEARSRFWLIDRPGLLREGLTGL